MQYRIEYIKEKLLIGIQAPMSLAENKTYELFSTFMPKRKAIPNAIVSHVYDLRIYPKHYYLNFNANIEFVKWAAVEVTKLETFPDGMEPYILSEGKYVVFDQDTNSKPFQYIFSEWLPQSGFVIDNRPHFEIFSGMTKKNDPDTKQEIWVPIK